MSSNEEESHDDDASRLLLLLTDILGDLNILERDNTLWTPDSVKKSLQEKNNGGGMELVSNVLSRLQSLGGDKSDITDLKSWDDLHVKYQAYCPPWVSVGDLYERPLISKLEILSFLASTLQNRMLRKAKTQSGNSTTMPNNVKSPESHDSGSDRLSLPSHLTKEQREKILQCYTCLKADYDKRRIGMKQRLDILVSNFEADNAEDKEVAELRAKLQNLSFPSWNPSLVLSREDLCKHFTSPHSSIQNLKTSSQSTSNSKPKSPLENLPVIDRGGRPDDGATRVSMPEWSSKTER